MHKWPEVPAICRFIPLPDQLFSAQKGLYTRNLRDFGNKLGSLLINNLLQGIFFMPIGVKLKLISFLCNTWCRYFKSAYRCQIINSRRPDIH
jgi:hypothetical protein